MRPLSKTLFIAAALSAACLGGLEARHLIFQRDEIAAQSAQNSDLRRQADQLRQQLSETNRALAQARQAASDAAALDHAPGPDAAERQSWLTRTRRLKALFAERPDQVIPEMRLLTERDWLSVSRDASFDTDVDTRKALASVRSYAKSHFTHDLNSALRRYTKASNGQLPVDLLQLAPYFDSPPDPAMLQRYAMTMVGKVSDAPADAAIEERGVTDPTYDGFFHVQASGGYGSASGPMAEFSGRFNRAMSAYRRATGSRPTEATDVLPYFNPPLDETQQKRLFDALTKLPKSAR